MTVLKLDEVQSVPPLEVEYGDYTVFTFHHISDWPESDYLKVLSTVKMLEKENSLAKTGKNGYKKAVKDMSTREQEKLLDLYFTLGSLIGQNLRSPEEQASWMALSFKDKRKIVEVWQGWTLENKEAFKA